MPKLILQAGHEGTTTGATGAPGEQSFNIDISNQVAFELSKRGFTVQRVNANPTDTEIGGDWDLFLAIHYDADIYGMGGGFVDFPEPSTDGATLESQRIAYLLRQEYFGTTKIVSHPERSNANTRFYYMWKRLSAKTPCVLIECGVGFHVPDDHEILHFNRPLVVEGIVKGICLAFNVPYGITPPAPLQPAPEPIPTPEPTVTPPPPLAYPNLSSEFTACSNKLGGCEIDLSNQLAKISRAKTIIYGKGWPWVKLNALKVLVPND